MKTLCLTAATVLGVVVAGCATQTPTELMNARTAYQEATQCPGSALAAPDVYEAKKSLDVAERSFADDGDAPETRDLAYVAQRKSLIAKSRCNTAMSMQVQKQALAEANQLRQQQEMAMRQKLGERKEQLGATKEQLGAAQQELDRERLARTAEMEQKPTTLTISGSMLFASGKSTLLPSAQARLKEVITALKDRTGKVLIVGHTDSKGDEGKNQALSEKRADAVRNYLTTHGIEASRVETKGVGEQEPVSDNSTPEGRANNRRVDIVLGGGIGTQPAENKGKTGPESKPVPESKPAPSPGNVP